MSKFTVEVTYRFENVEADTEEEAEALVDSVSIRNYVKHPVTGELVQPDYSVYENIVIFWRTKDKSRRASWAG